MYIEKTIPRGNYGVLLTPFTSDRNINKQAFSKQIQFCIDSSLSGLLVCGSTSEFIYMSPEQIKEVYSLVANQVEHKKLLIGGASAPTENAVLDYMFFLDDIGYEYSIVCPPYYYPQRPDDILRFYSFIAAKAPKGMKLLLYNIPMCTPAIPLNILSELILIDNIVGLKDSSGDFTYLARALNIADEVRPEFSIFTGQDITLLPSLTLGAQGCITALAWILYAPLCEVLSSYDNGDINRAKLLQKALISITALADKIPFPENYRALAMAAGIYCGEPQRTFSELKASELEDFVMQAKLKINKLINL